MISGSGGGKHNVNSNTHASQHACSSLCDEVVVLWRLAALNPGLAPFERDMLHNQVKSKLSIENILLLYKYTVLSQGDSEIADEKYLSKRNMLESTRPPFLIC